MFGSTVSLSVCVKLYSSNIGNSICDCSRFISNSTPDPRVSGSQGFHVSEGAILVRRILADAGERTSTVTAMTKDRQKKARRSPPGGRRRVTPPPDHGRLIEIKVATSPPVASVRTIPIPLAYHLYSLPDSSIDQSFVFTQPVNVPTGTVTVSLVATICAMSSALLGKYSCRYG